MNKIFRQLGSFAGVILSTTVLLILVFFVLNQISKRTPAPISGYANWAETHANGTAYAQPMPQPMAVVSSPSSVAYMGPAL